jgi:hypothetical protein
LFSWQKTGNAIFGESLRDEFGTSVSLSNDGKTIAVAVPTIATLSDNTFNGNVRVYPLNNNAAGGGDDNRWHQMGPIVVQNSGTIASHTVVCLSGNGRVVGVRAYRKVLYDGVVCFYYFEETMTTSESPARWTRVGSAINVDNSLDDLRHFISLSNDSTTAVIGAPLACHNQGRVWVYARGTDWRQMGSDLDGHWSHDFFGALVGVLGDGTVIALGGPGSNHVNSDGYV